jgi:hypothetical protein
MGRRGRVRARRRALIRDAVWAAAQHKAFGDLNTVERNAGLGYQGRDKLRFGPRVHGSVCDCGEPVAWIPAAHRWKGRDEVWPLGVCGFCSYEDIILEHGPRLLTVVEAQIIAEEQARGYSELDTVGMLA